MNAQSILLSIFLSKHKIQMTYSTTTEIPHRIPIGRYPATSIISLIIKLIINSPHILSVKFIHSTPMHDMYSELWFRQMNILCTYNYTYQQQMLKLKIKFIYRYIYFSNESSPVLIYAQINATLSTHICYYEKRGNQIEKIKKY